MLTIISDNLIVETLIMRIKKGLITGADFYFTGDMRVAPSWGDLAGAQFALGLVSTMIAKHGSPKTYRLAIDHLNGEFVHIRAIQPPDQCLY